MKHVIIYVPGLGDKARWLVRLQKMALRLWRVRGVRTEVMPLLWTDPIPLRPRFEKLLLRIDTLHSEGKTVSLIGTSAGASAVISAFVERPELVNGVVTICGKIQGDLPDSVKELNPSFAESYKQLNQSVKQLSPERRNRILNIYSPLDAVVPSKQAILPGAHTFETRALGHNPTCAYVLLFKSKEITRFLKKLTK